MSPQCEVLNYEYASKLGKNIFPPWKKWKPVKMIFIKDSKKREWSDTSNKLIWLRAVVKELAAFHLS